MINIFKRWFSHSKEQDIDDSQNPWAGLASYEDPETAERKLKFCGRDDDSYDLARLIMGNVFVTLYGKSGIGKTSLLNAGVFPELREEQYTPVSIRLGMRDEVHPQSYQTMIVKAVERVVKRTETINVIDEQQDQKSIDYLWNYFARHRFYDKYDEQTTPVIVFDQFEEVFRGYRDEAETLLRQLDYLNDKDHSLDNCEVDGQPYRYEQNFRFVVSIREDDLYRLEDSIDNCYLPALKRCRYRLRSLSEDGARDVILIPGEGLFDEQEQDRIVKTITGLARNKEDGSINTNVLSLICNRIYVDNKETGSIHITPTYVDSFVRGNPIEQFYSEAVSILPHKTREKLEKEMVTEDGHRKYIEEKIFNNYVKDERIRRRFLEGSRKIFQYTFISSDNRATGIELIHDSFCDAIMSLRRKRLRRRYHFFAAFIAMLLFTIIGESIYLLYLRQKPVPMREWTLRLTEIGNNDNIKWSADYTIKPLHNDSILAKGTLYLGSIESKFKDQIVYTPSNIMSCRIHIELSDTIHFCKIKDSVIDFLENPHPIVVHQVQGIAMSYHTLTIHAYINNEKEDNHKKALQNTFITFNTPSVVNHTQDYTNKDGLCTFTGMTTQPDETCYITAMHDGFLLKSENMSTWKEGDTLEIGLSPIPFMIKDVTNQIKDRIIEVSSRYASKEKKLNYTQTLKIHYDNGDADDVVYLGAYEDSIDKRTFGVVKGIYYYHKDHPHKYDWGNVPSNKVYLIDGYTDIGQMQDGQAFSFFTGTDSLYNKQYFSGMIKGNTVWHGTLTTPNKVGISGTY